MGTRWASVLTPALFTRMSSRPHSRDDLLDRRGDLVGLRSRRAAARGRWPSRRRGLRFLGDEIGVVDDAAVRREAVGDGLADAPRARR